MVESAVVSEVRSMVLDITYDLLPPPQGPLSSIAGTPEVTVVPVLLYVATL
jgi:hypothetical protein